MNRNLPTRKLRAHPDLNQLKRQAKELLAAFAAGQTAAVDEVNTRYRDADAATFALHDAQLVLARSYGFESWPKLKAFVDGVTIKRFAEAVQANDTRQVRAMLKARPELATMGIDNYQVVHLAVLNRAPEIVKLLMEHGDNARAGIYPHRDATSALTIAQERGYDEIVAIIEAEEERRRVAQSGGAASPSPEDLMKAILSGDEERAMSLVDADPALVHSSDGIAATPLHIAARPVNERLIQFLLERGADPSRRDSRGFTPLEEAAHSSDVNSAGAFRAIATLLLQRGAEMTPRAAVAFGDIDWLRARHAAGELTNTTIHWSGGLLRVAASHNRPEILDLLLGFGFDADERIRLDAGDEAVFSWGMPLWHCALTGKYAMAEVLLQHGADPNGRVFAAGEPITKAYIMRDWAMVDLIRRYGGVLQATAAGSLRQTELARQILAGETDFRLEGDGGDTAAEQLLWGAATSGDSEIVRMALEQVTWPRDDIRWFYILEQPLRVADGRGDPDWPRSMYLECFRLLVERVDPNLRGRVGDNGRFGLTLLHSVAGLPEHVTPEERLAFATILLDAGARLDLRDNVLRSTPLGWASRWGRPGLVRLLLERGADPVETEAEPWATPVAWAEKMKHHDVLAQLRERIK